MFQIAVVVKKGKCAISSQDTLIQLVTRLKIQCKRSTICLGFFIKNYLFITLGLVGFKSHQHYKGYVTTFQLCWWRKTSCAFCVLLQVRPGTWAEPPTIPKLAGQLHHIFCSNKLFISLNYKIFKKNNCCKC